MNHWLFVTAAYVLMLGGTGALTWWSWASMRAAERFADEVTKR